MNLERDIYTLLLRKLTNRVTKCYFWAERPDVFGWGVNLEKDLNCSVVKSLVTNQFECLNLWIDEGWKVDKLLGGGLGCYKGEGVLKNCTRLKEILILAEFHATLINNNDIVGKLNELISKIKEIDIWVE